jgi:hypothetical protein
MHARDFLDLTRLKPLCWAALDVDAKASTDLTCARPEGALKTLNLCHWG